MNFPTKRPNSIFYLPIKPKYLSENVSKVAIFQDAYISRKIVVKEQSIIIEVAFRLPENEKHFSIVLNSNVLKFQAFAFKKCVRECAKNFRADEQKQ